MSNGQAHTQCGDAGRRDDLCPGHEFFVSFSIPSLHFPEMKGAQENRYLMGSCVVSDKARHLPSSVLSPVKEGVVLVVGTVCGPGRQQTVSDIRLRLHTR